MFLKYVRNYRCNQIRGTSEFPHQSPPKASGAFKKLGPAEAP